MADALSSEPACLAEIEASKARRVVELSGSSSEGTEEVGVSSEHPCVSLPCTLLQKDAATLALCF